VSLLASESVVLYLIKFQIDRAGLFILGVYSLSSIMQAVTWVYYLISSNLPEESDIPI
jgi:hypothetical protein